MTDAKKRATSATPKKDDATGKWYFVVDLGQGGDGGRRQAKRRGFLTKKAANEELNKLREGVRTATYVPPRRQTLGNYLAEDWLPSVRHELAASTWESYERNVRNHVVPALGGAQLQQLDGTVLTRFYSDLLTSGRMRGTQSPGLKARTVRYIHTILSAALHDAVKSRRIPINPASQAKPPSAEQAKAPEMKVWTGGQVGQFLTLTEGDRYYWPWLFLATTGCRRGEGLGVRW
ncbi:MAG: site-specific integrase [Acidimicrobiales bacterium]